MVFFTSWKMSVAKIRKRFQYATPRWPDLQKKKAKKSGIGSADTRNGVRMPYLITFPDI